MRANKDLIGIFILLMLFVAAAVFMGGRPTATSHQVGEDGPVDPSIYNDRVSGSMAFYEFVHKAGYKPSVLTAGWSTLAPSRATFLVAVAPQLEEPSTL